MMRRTEKYSCRSMVFMFREQIEEKKTRLQSKNEDKRAQMVDDFIKKSNSNKSSKLGTNYSPAVTSSRYLNTNTA